MHEMQSLVDHSTEGLLSTAVLESKDDHLQLLMNKGVIKLQENDF